MLNLDLPVAPRRPAASGSGATPTGLASSVDIARVQSPRPSRPPPAGRDDAGGDAELRSDGVGDSPARASSETVLAAPAWDGGAEHLAVAELSSLCALVQAKSDRVSAKERDIHRSQCAQAETIGAAQAQLRLEAEALLQASQVELRRQVSLEKRRLDDLLRRTQDEFRKVAEARRELRTHRGTAAAAAEERARLMRRVQEEQRRCTALAGREKSQRQTLEEERQHWEKERQRFEVDQSRLLRKVQELLQQRQYVSDVAHNNQAPRITPCNSPPRLAPDDGRGHAENDVNSTIYYPAECETPGDPAPNARYTAPATSNSECADHAVPVAPPLSQPSVSETVWPQTCFVSLFGAWWGLDYVAASGPRGLWGSTVLLSEILAARRLDHVDVDESCTARLHQVAECFVRRWAWQLLVVDTRSAWRAARDDELAASPFDPERNALAWARQCHAARLGVSGAAGATCGRPLAIETFDLQTWLPGRRKPLEPVQRCLEAVLSAHLQGASRPTAGAGDGADGAPHLAILRPPEAQRRFAAQLWQQAQRLLPSVGQPLRNTDLLADLARTLLAAAALSLGPSPGDALAALRALLGLCGGGGGRAEALRGELPDALPVLLWLADVSGAASGATASAASGAAGGPPGRGFEGGARERQRPQGRQAEHLGKGLSDVLVSLLAALAHPGLEPAEAASLATAALLRAAPGAAPGAAAAAPQLARLLERAAASSACVGQAPSAPASLRPRLRRWLELHRSTLLAELGAEASGAVAAHVEAALGLMDAVP